MIAEEVVIPFEYFRELCLQSYLLSFLYLYLINLLYLEAFPAFLGYLGMHGASFNALRWDHIAQNIFTYRLELLLEGHPRLEPSLMFNWSIFILNKFFLPVPHQMISNYNRPSSSILYNEMKDDIPP